MILELSLAAALATAIAGAAATYRAKRKRSVSPGTPRNASDAPRNLAVGDVVLSGTDEHWIAGSIWLVAGEAFGTLHRTPPAPGAWLFERPAARGRPLVKLQERAELAASGLSDRMRIDGKLMLLESRDAIVLHPNGEELPAWPRTADYKLLATSTGSVALQLTFLDGVRVVLVGDELPNVGLDILPGGG